MCVCECVRGRVGGGGGAVGLGERMRSFGVAAFNSRDTTTEWLLWHVVISSLVGPSGITMTTVVAVLRFLQRFQITF